MFRASDVRKALLNVNGWRIDQDIQEFIISESLSISETGIFFQQAHPLLTLQNIKAIAPNFEASDKDILPYDNSKNYIIGNLVTYNNKIYRRISATSDTPDNQNIWEEFSSFSRWLEIKTGDSIMTAATRFVNEKIARSAGKRILENKALFDGAGRLSDIDITNTGIVGFEIVTGRARNLTVRINKIGTQFTGTGPLKLYLFHSSNQEPIKVFNFSRTKANSIEWFVTLDIDLPYMGTATDSGGSWYLCYDKNELPVDVHPIYKSRDWSSTPCLTCDQSAAGMNAMSKYLEIYPFRANSAFGSTPELWDITENSFTQYSNHGLNIEISVVCDITDFIVTQKRMFSDVILLQVAVDMLKEMCYNPSVRVNRNALAAQRNELIFALDGDPSSFKRSGLVYQLELAYKSLDIDLSGIDKVCLPNKNGGIKYRTV